MNKVVFSISYVALLFGISELMIRVSSKLIIHYFTRNGRMSGDL